MHDLVIRGGTVVDGTGAPPVTAHVAIDGGRIVEVGPDVGLGIREIDAHGLLVTPGFVDLHTHYDGQATWDPVLAPSSNHGVTTLAMGNCGVGFAPARPDRHDWLIGLLEGVEDIPGTALAEGLTWGWESFPDYLDSLERQPRAVDIGAHVPHAALRTYVMGDRGADHLQHPSSEEVAMMAKLVGEALDAGAIGFATSRTEVHRTRDGANIGTLQVGAEELQAIAAAMARGEPASSSSSRTATRPPTTTSPSRSWPSSKPSPARRGAPSASPCSRRTTRRSGGGTCWTGWGHGGRRAWT